MKSTNRRWQNHLRAKGIIPFLLDRLQGHALSSQWQFDKGAFHFPIEDRDLDDELTRAYFELTEYFPYEICIEITNRCNLSCKMCARPQMKRPRGVMTQALFERIIDEVAAKQPYAYLHYYGIGEPLVDPGLYDKLHYARAKDVRNTIIFSNGQLLLAGDNVKRLAESGVAIIGVDLDGFCQETYGQIRVGGQFDLAKQGIERLYDYVRGQGLRTRIEIAYQIYPDVNEKDIAPFVAWCDRNAYEYKLVPMHTWAGLRSDIPSTHVAGLADQHHAQRACACSALWSNLMIAWDGRVGLCFQDADVREPLGDLNSQTIEEVWMGGHLRKRREHLDGKFEGLCQYCDSYTSVELPPKGSSLYPKTVNPDAAP
ncbi:MAG: radical SAM protein [Phycisphaerae bacterium]|nr:radical SAM protein [Phycisphaerae bacterium]